MLDSVDSFFQTTLGNMPLAVVTIALLAAPTIVYLIYRLSVPTASHGRARSSAPAGAQWVCPRCRSVNDLQSSRCYHCDFRVDDAGDDLLVIDSITAKPIILPPPPVERPAVAVGPGPQPTAAPPVVVPFSVPSGPAPAQPSDPRPSSPGPAPAAPVIPGVPVGPGRTRVPATPASGVAIASAVGAKRPFDSPAAPVVVAAAAPVVVARPIVVAAGPAPKAAAAAPKPAAADPEPAAPPVPEPAVAAAAPIATTTAEPAVAAAPPPAPTKSALPDEAVRPTPRPVRPAPRLIVAVPFPDQTSESDGAPPAG